jgi:hypothetical protein
VFSILHISDLHRSATDNITNDELVSALVGDRSHYLRENPPIRAPDAIFISGDIIQGVPVGATDAASKLAEQYATAESFIVELTKHFVGGDRSKVVIIPGNHDVDWVTARSAMTLVGEEDVPKDLSSELSREDTLYRWSWKNRELFKITDNTAYDRRLDAFWTFFKRFYDGVPGLLRVQPNAAVNLYSFCDNRIGVAAFDSCHGNDCFSFHGRVPREVVARAHLDLVADNAHKFELLIAVWHHNIEGPPYRSDYMDVDTVRGMIGRGFRVGLFGHQHRPQVVPHQIHLAELETMAIIGAGSLCAGARELPPGSHRGYNIIEIADDMRSARIHVREASVANLFARSPRPAFGGNSWTTLNWETPPDLMGRPVDYSRQKIAAALEVAEIAIRQDRPKDCIMVLRSLGEDIPTYGRQLLIDAAKKLNDRITLIDVLTPPRTIGELIDLFNVTTASRQFPQARTVLSRYSIDLALPDAMLRELHSRLDAEEAMAK